MNILERFKKSFEKKSFVELTIQFQPINTTVLTNINRVMPRGKINHHVISFSFGSRDRILDIRQSDNRTSLVQELNLANCFENFRRKSVFARKWVYPYQPRETFTPTDPMILTRPL